MKCIEDWNYEKLIEFLKENIKEYPDDASLRERLALLYATCPEEKFRDGEQAVALARKACQLTNWQDSDSLSALAAAYAECANFEKAIECEKKAIKLCEKTWGELNCGHHENRLAAYKKKKTWRQERL
jgi:tetratricopeptide (TPR) repeat protein